VDNGSQSCKQHLPHGLQHTAGSDAAQCTSSMPQHASGPLHRAGALIWEGRVHYREDRVANLLHDSGSVPLRWLPPISLQQQTTEGHGVVQGELSTQRLLSRCQVSQCVISSVGAAWAVQALLVSYHFLASASACEHAACTTSHPVPTLTEMF
jgi:hypothetical protein